jgi:hypothetical protein
MITAGMYQRDGIIYKVQENREKTRCYAKKLQECNGARFAEAGDVVHFEFVYDRGAVWSLSPDDQMTETQAKEFGVRTGMCCVCAAPLKDAVSVARGIGPTCAKKTKVLFRPAPTMTGSVESSETGALRITWRNDNGEVV